MKRSEMKPKLENKSFKKLSTLNLAKIIGGVTPPYYPVEEMWIRENR